MIQNVHKLITVHVFVHIQTLSSRITYNFEWQLTTANVNNKKRKIKRLWFHVHAEVKFSSNLCQMWNILHSASFDEAKERKRRTEFSEKFACRSLEIIFSAIFFFRKAKKKTFLYSCWWAPWKLKRIASASKNIYIEKVSEYERTRKEKPKKNHQQTCL